MILLRLISWQYVRKHVLRSVLTMAGIVLGVAVFVGMHTANQSVLYAFQRTVDRIAGATQLQVWAGGTGFAEEVLERVQAVPEVGVAVPIIEAVVSTGLEGQGNLLILSVDMLGDRSLREYDLEAGDEEVIEDPLVFLAQPDSLIVTHEFAARNGLAINSVLPLSTMEGEKRFTIRGIMRSGGWTSAFGGNLAVMDIYAAQKVFGRGRQFDRIDVRAKEGISIEQCQAALRKALGPGFQVEPPSGRVQHFDSVLRVYSMTVNLSSVVAGDREQMYRLGVEGKGAMISDNLAQLQGLSLDDVLRIPAPSGLLVLPVVGITRDFSDQQGSVLVDRAVFQRYWKDDAVNLFRIYLKPGASPAEVKRRILEKFAGDRRLFVLSNEDVRRYILRLIDKWFGLTYVQIAMAVLVSMPGIVNTLTVSITDRRRELGVLQAVGGLRRQIRHTVWIEALSIGLIGLVLGLALGAVNLYYTLEMSRRDFSGMRFDYQYPFPIALVLLPVILAAAWFSALWPAESAVRGSLVEALEYE